MSLKNCLTFWWISSRLQQVIVLLSFAQLKAWSSWFSTPCPVMQPRQEGLSEWIAIQRTDNERDFYRSCFGIYYGNSIAVAIRSFDPLLSTRLIDRDLFISDLAITNPEESGDFRMWLNPQKESVQRRDYHQSVVEVNYCQ